ncbi:GGDEF domain-containing protein [Salipaludibacillus daqingensis]|uniref:GGDEF domain-containing protein n=1 Tax=Salipaludibacillus daqingensis TaxID=3041001 RepID=UPI002473266D|nr:diguanylate cyclase [Salipaludibacillus daqingensis]
MDHHDASQINYELWSKKILNFYWLIVIISLVGHIVGLSVTIYYHPDYASQFIFGTIILATGIQLLIVLICEYIIKIKKMYRSRLLIIAGTLLALVVIVINPAVPGLQVTLLLPMGVALIYLDKKKLFFSLIANVFGLTSIYLLFPSIRLATTEYEYFSYVFALFAGYIIYLAILQRGEEVLSDLRESSEKEKDLLIKNTLMEKLTKVDPLTNLYNHRTFHEYMDHLVKQSKEYQMPLQLAILDIDNFKKINDSFGHSVGDSVLKRVARTIYEKSSENDIVARYGGEEFAILFTNKKFEESLQITEKIRSHIASLHHEEIDDRSVTISIGLKNFDDHLTKADFFKQADAMLYEAKDTGKNKVVSNY